MKFKVIKFIDELSLQVEPNWEWGVEKGNIVHLDIESTLNETYSNSKKKIENLLLGKEIELKNPKRLVSGKLLCEIIFQGKNIIEYISL